MEAVVPRFGWFRYLNPVRISHSCSYTYRKCFALKGPFNKKENAFIIVMASSAANVAMATEVFAAQALFYKIMPKGLAPMFLLTSTQFLGYGIAGLMRREFSSAHLILMNMSQRMRVFVKRSSCTPRRCYTPASFPCVRCLMPSITNVAPANTNTTRRD